MLRLNAERWAASSREETHLLLEAAGLVPGTRVLDLACGPGDPSIEAARRVGPSGHVTGVDPSAGALEVARERAQRAGLTNVEFREGRAEAIPLPDAAVERAVCRFGAMFFEDPPRAAGEIRRVLAPSGKVALMVWGPFDQPHNRAAIGVVLRHLGLAELPPEKRTPYRYAEPGPLEEGLAAAGFSDVRGKTRTVRWVWEGTPGSARDDFRDNAVFFRSLLDALPEAERPAVWAEVEAGFRRFYDGERLRIPQVVRVVTGTR